MEAFWKWIIGEAGVGCLFGVIAMLMGLGGAFYTWLHRERPTKVIVQEYSESSLLSIHPSQLENLKIFFTRPDGSKKQIHNLRQKRFLIYNSGTKDINEPIHLSLKWQESKTETRTQGFSLLSISSNMDCTSQLILDDKQNFSIGAEITIPYLNSVWAHDHQVVVDLFSEQQVQLKTLAGAGKGWSSRLVTFEKAHELENRFGIFSSSSFILLILTFFGGMFGISLLMARFETLAPPLLILLLFGTVGLLLWLLNLLMDALRRFDRWLFREYAGLKIEPVFRSEDFATRLHDHIIEAFKR